MTSAHTDRNTASEHDEQKALFEWSSLCMRKYPELVLMFAVPNGGARNIVVARKLKAEGVKAGVPDVFLPVARGRHHGMAIEMKRVGGRASGEQKAWLKALEEQGYYTAICEGWEAAKNEIERYLNGEVA